MAPRRRRRQPSTSPSPAQSSSHSSPNSSPSTPIPTSPPQRPRKRTTRPEPKTKTKSEPTKSSTLANRRLLATQHETFISTTHSQIDDLLLTFHSRAQENHLTKLARLRELLEKKAEIEVKIVERMERLGRAWESAVREFRVVVEDMITCINIATPAIPIFASYPRKMPKSNVPIAAPLLGALIECFRATTRLVRPELRRQLVLVGGVASIAHSSNFKTEDVDVAAPSSLLIDIWKGISSGGAHSFSLEPDGRIAFDAPQGFIVHLDLIEIGEGCIELVNAAEPFHEGSVASMSELLRLRAVTVVDRGSDGDVDDFRWLLSRVAESGQLLPGYGKDDLEWVMKAGECGLGRLDRLVLWALLAPENAAVGMRLIF
ncbi:MAG: hypothetical protein Q9227_006010 [Pyrenula ochraceoflavens]